MWRVLAEISFASRSIVGCRPSLALHCQTPDRLHLSPLAGVPLLSPPYFFPLAVVRYRGPIHIIRHLVRLASVVLGKTQRRPIEKRPSFSAGNVV